MKVRPALVLGVVLAAGGLRGADWPQFGCDSAHSGFNPCERFLSTFNVSRLQRIYRVSLPDVADGAPAFAGRISTPGGIKDLLFVTTKDGRLIALDAATGSILWSHQAATTPNYTTSSPALDPSRAFVYSYGLDGFVHKYHSDDGLGAEVTTGGWPEKTTNKPDVEKGSSAIALATDNGGASRLYMASAGYPGDAGDYQGHITTVDLSTGTQRVFNAACSDKTIHFVENGTPGVDDCSHVQTAIWARPGVVFGAATNRIYAATGNGDFDGSVAWGDSVFSLAANGTGASGKPLDTYTPTNFANLDSFDLDLGSTAPALLPPLPASLHPHVGVQGGKDGILRLIDLDDMSGQAAPGHIGGQLQILSVSQGNAIFPTPAVWTNLADGKVWLFASNYSGVSGLNKTLVSGVPHLSTKWTNSGPSTSSPVVANGVLYVFDSNGIHALNPVTGASLWSDTSTGDIHWESPIVVNGTLFVTDESAGLSAYTVTNGFSDVGPGDPFAAEIDLFGKAGITSGCGNGNYCPNTPVIRSQMAVFLLRAIHGSCYSPPPCEGLFVDVPCSSTFSDWIDELYREHITQGCGGGQYCPSLSVPREQMAIFLLRLIHGSSYTPPPCTGIFSDVPCPGPYTDWIEELYAEQVTHGCGAGVFCPLDSVSRGQIAAFIVRELGLP